MREKRAGVFARLKDKIVAEMPPASAAVLTMFSTFAMLACAWWFGLREDWRSEYISVPPSPEFIRAQQAAHANYRVFPNSNSRMHGPQGAERPLGKGSRLPLLDVSGWLNGRVSQEILAGKVLVIDVWDGACPYCSLAAPALLAAYDKYRVQGVVFVGLTSANRSEASQYVDHWQLPWPNGYEATEAIDALKAHAPTLFVAGSDGRVLWNDDRARWRHDYADLGQRLHVAIENALQEHPQSSIN